MYLLRYMKRFKKNLPNEYYFGRSPVMLLSNSCIIKLRVMDYSEGE